MPQKGFKSITITTQIYNYFEQNYKDRLKNNTLPPGIHSFTGYIVYRMGIYIQEKKEWKKLDAKIKFVHPKFTTSKMQIKFLKQ